MTEPMRFLASYAYFRDRDMGDFRSTLASGEPVEIFADSGAHSARTLGIDVSLPGYSAWCRRWDAELVAYSNLDVIKAPELTWRNQQAMEADGFTPLPVFHTGSPWRHLERYLDHGYTYIALGALLKNPPNVLMPWLAKAFRLADGKAVFHGFGMTVIKALREFPFYSVDSSTWTSSFRYGDIRLFDQRAGNLRVLLPGDTAAFRRWRDLIRVHGADPAQLAVAYRTRDSGLRVKIALAAFQRMQEWARMIHGPIAVPDGPRNPLTRPGHDDRATGLRLYLAGSDNYIAWAMSGSPAPAGEATG
jgi:hypothetical protein